ncbi:MAG TPA: MG2 domain-containing protein [Pyrinomonadaceae bacterium]|nr:MG2 domain-containing protein [Pyrinomonadaceae bacterium]
MRRRSWASLLFCLLIVSPLLSQLSTASTALRVNEAETRILLEGDQARASLAVENPTGRAFAAHVKLEVLDPQGKAVATVESDETIRGGKFSLVAPLPLRPKDMSDDEALWYRLRYRITPQPTAGETGTNGVEGIVSLSEITPDIFQLRVVAPERASAGTRYRAQVFAAHPVTMRPVKGVSLEAKLGFDGDELQDSQLAGVTDADGRAEFAFDLPAKIEDEEDFHLEFVARRGPLVEEAEQYIDFDRAPQIFVGTDKPIYQPGQVLHARALLFDSLKRAQPGRDATLKIRDPDSKTIFEAELKSSRFGVVSADWAIPEDIPLGDYNLKVETDGDGVGADGEGEAVVKISRYEIPNFAVQVKPDLPYYLPGQNATVEVRADYLFGRPVKRGRVRVVRESSRHWDYRAQKWDVDEGEKYEGETDERGAFLARMDLSEEHAELQGEDYSRFRDISYAAYFTDPTTNRTEQRRFDLRLTKSAVHVYVIEGGEHQARGFPLKFYLSTYYADGSPAACDVVISETIAAAGPAASSVSFYEQPLRTVHTNRLGLAEVDGLELPRRAQADGAAALTFLAHDGKGATGRQSNSFWYGGRPVLRLDTDKTFYREGEPVRVSLAASEPEVKAVVDVWLGPNVVQSRAVRLRGGRASLSVPYDKAFKGGALRLTAYTYGQTAAVGSGMATTARRVLYPGEGELKLDVRLDRATYKPGEEAKADFRVRAVDGRPVESALGVVVFDKAVEERARTDREFGHGYGFSEAYRGLAGDEGEYLKLDLSRPVPEGMELAAEIALNGQEFRPRVFVGGYYSMDQREVFSELIASQLRPAEQALSARYSAAAEYPKDEASLRRALADAGLDFDRQRDPWGTAFRASFNVEREQDVLTFASAGADKRFDTADDFTAARLSWPYFRPLGETLDRAVGQFHRRTGGHVRDAQTLEGELRSAGLDFKDLRDRWGKPYVVEFGTIGSNFTVAVRSGGPDGKLSARGEESPDDFTVWTSYSDYFAERRAEITSSLADHFKLTGLFPQNETELRAALSKSGVSLRQTRDLWGRDYYVVFTNDPRRAAAFRIQTYSTYAEATRKEVSPLTQSLNLISLRSRGSDGVQGTADDFDVASLSRRDVELIAKGGPATGQALAATVLTGASGAVTGTITDPLGAVVAGATVTATGESDNAARAVMTDDEGNFLLGNLPAGYYTLKAEAPGFRAYVIEHVPVRSSNVTRLDAMLDVGAVAETVSIISESSVSVNTLSATRVGKANNFLLDGLSAGREQTATPRLREYFPETLVWQPLMETDARGRAQLAFKLADNITTWKMAVISSTTDGEVGLVEKEIRAFQPFFVEHDPPRVLTEGDEIELGVVLRNYLDKPQAVDLEMKPETWFALLGPAHKRAEVASNDSSRETFGFRAVASVSEGRQRVTAAGSDASDAIEKPVSVHPDGEERAVTATRMLAGDSTALALPIPEETIKNSLRAELKIYPNLMSHVSESIEGILVRPHGCGEQTLSSTYPNLMILRFARSSGVESPVAARAREYLAEGYKRLLNYRADGGGFSYWGRGDQADLALTAYALRFLTDARGYVELDEGVLGGARDHLIRQQREDGSWASPQRYGPSVDAPRRDLTLTSYVALAIAGAEQKGARKALGGGAASAAAPQSASALSLKRALGYLARHADGANDAYMLAAYAQVAAAAGETSQAARAVSKLRALARAGEEGSTFWETEFPTPFHGWGNAGRLETTALALQALNDCGLRTADCGLGNSSSSNLQLIDGALFYLLRQKDRHGVWLSTQATVNVLNALIAVFSGREAGQPATGGGEVEVIINGRAAATVTIPQGRLNNPAAVDISQFVAPGSNEVLIRRGGGPRQLASAQVVSTFYVPWAARQTAHAADDPVRLSVNFSKTQAGIGEEITCRVEAAGRNAGGMLLAEIGLPPGADVDRASLELAMKNYGISRYDVQPDRVTVYLWPRTGGTTFEFKFRPRFGLNAQSAPSLIYDYYNPDARAVVAPTRFMVK